MARRTKTKNIEIPLDLKNDAKKVAAKQKLKLATFITSVLTENEQSILLAEKVVSQVDSRLSELKQLLAEVTAGAMIANKITKIDEYKSSKANGEATKFLSQFNQVEFVQKPSYDYSAKKHHVKLTLPLAMYMQIERRIKVNKQSFGTYVIEVLEQHLYSDNKHQDLLSAVNKKFDDLDDVYHYVLAKSLASAERLREKGNYDTARESFSQKARAVICKD